MLGHCRPAATCFWKHIKYLYKWLEGRSAFGLASVSRSETYLHKGRARKVSVACLTLALLNWPTAWWSSQVKFDLSLINILWSECEKSEIQGTFVICSTNRASHTHTHWEGELWIHTCVCVNITKAAFCPGLSYFASFVARLFCHMPPRHLPRLPHATAYFEAFAASNAVAVAVASAVVIRNLHTECKGNCAT